MTLNDIAASHDIYSEIIISKQVFSILKILDRGKKMSIISKRTICLFLSCALFLSALTAFSGCSDNNTALQQSSAVSATSTETANTEIQYSYNEYPLSRNSTPLHLDCIKLKDSSPSKNILLTHGVTYSSHEFDIDYKDYSLVRKLAREGYAVWRLDIAGFGRSGDVTDGFIPDSDYAAEDINAAVEMITKESGQDKIDILGWSWGTVTASRYAAKYSDHLNKLVLYAPILSGLGEYEVKEDFHHNTWEHAADDFQRDENGRFDYNITEPEMIEMFCSSCWHYDGESSPNGGRRDICVSKTEKLIDLSKITVPTLVICGSNDSYLNYDLVNSSLDSLPDGSSLEVIEGGAHVIMYEKPYYLEFQNKLTEFLYK